MPDLSLPSGEPDERSVIIVTDDVSHSRRRRAGPGARRRAAIVLACLLTGASLVATAAARPALAAPQDPRPTPADPDGWAEAVAVARAADDPPPDDELPDWGLPYMLPRFAPYDVSVEALKTGADPTCPAPPLPAATEAGSAEGYTVPLRLKLTDGIILAAYSDKSRRWGQKAPFGMRFAGLTGWITARVALPALTIDIAPGDVTLCDAGSKLAAIGAFPRALLEPGEWLPQYAMEQPDGTQFIPYPGSLSTAFEGLMDLRLEQFVADRVKATVTGLSADGSLELSTELASTQTASNAHVRPPDNATTCPGITMDGTFGTAPKERVTPQPPPAGSITMTDTFSGAQRSYTPGLPVRQPKVYLPTRPLSGAVEGGRATIGSNWFDVRVPSPGTPGSARCGGELNLFFYGADDQGQPNFRTEVADWDAFEWWFLDPSGPGGQPIVPGLADFSIDVTVDRVGLPRFADVAPGSGFD